MHQISVVLDTNVFVGAGFNPGSASAEMIEAVRNGDLHMPWSDLTRAETRRILQKIPPLAWDDVAEVFRPEARLDVEVDEDRFSAVPDPEDRKFAALALEAGAILVSSDRHLLDHVEGLQVRPPGRWWEADRDEPERDTPESDTPERD